MRLIVGTKRLLLAVALTFAALAVGVGPAGATPPPPQVLSASAFWQLNDANSNAVSLQITRTPDQKSLFVLVTQQFCDTATDERVFRGFSAQVPVSGVAQVNAQLRHAVLATTVTGNQTEQRLASCANPSGIPTFVNLGPATVAILAGWLGTGPITPVQPGIEARAARATGAIVGPNTLAIGPLGLSQTAELRRSTL
jgi:hypothetical protein